MRKGLFIGGVVLLVIGLLIAVASLLPPAPQSASVPAGQDLSLTNPRLTATTLTVTWSGLSSSTQVYLVSTAPTPSACSSPTSVVANGTGASGSIASSVRAGGEVFLYGCSSSSFQAITVSISQSGGVNLGEVIGGALGAIGAILLVLGLRRTSPEDAGPVYAPPMQAAGSAAPPPTSTGAPVFGSAAPSGGPSAATTPRRTSKYVHGAPTTDGRTLRGCASCGAVSPTGTDRCPACGAPY